MKIFKSEETESTRTTLEAEVNAEGELVFSGGDIGRAPLETFGDSDYEWWIVVPKEKKDEVLLLLLREKFGHAQGTSAFMQWLDTNAIPHSFKSF